MLLLIFFAFIAGIVTILSPCILPLLPIVLSSSLTEGKRRPYGIVLGFVLSFTFFTLALATVVRLTGLPADLLRNIAIFAIAIFGVFLLVPQSQVWLEKLVSRFSNLVPSTQNRTGFGGGLIIGLSLGLLWAPCVGPILAAVITLALTSSVTLSAVLITLAYALGTAIPMFLIIQGGRQLLQKIPWLLRNSAKIQQAFGAVMILIAIAMWLNLDRRFQTYILQAFPEYGAGLTSFENNLSVQQNLDRLTGRETSFTAPGLRADGLQAPDFNEGGPWINSQPLSLAGDLKGKVVLVDFWTYSCINCIRTFPYLKGWYDTYKDQDFVIVGVHSPEFEFEKNYDNVLQATQDFGLTYPVVLDNQFAIWDAYQNRFWPAHYLIDKDGKIRYTHFGEGAYEETEAAIRALLQEAGQSPSASAEPSSEFSPNTRITPETYLGFNRLDRFAGSPLPQLGTQTYSLPLVLRADEVAYQGEWTLDPESASPAPGAALEIEFTARDVYLVMTAASEAQVRVLLDGEVIPPSVAGEDVKDGLVTLDKDRLYSLVKLQSPSRHTLRLEFLNPGIKVFAFTFG